MNAGQVTVSESAHTGTNGAFYAATYDCGAKGSGAGASFQFQIANGDVVTCTFTNTFVKQPSVTATQSSTNGSDVVPGASVTDAATVTGSGPTPTGTVEFFLCQPACGDREWV